MKVVSGASIRWATFLLRVCFFDIGWLYEFYYDGMFSFDFVEAWRQFVVDALLLLNFVLSQIMKCQLVLSPCKLARLL